MHIRLEVVANADTAVCLPMVPSFPHTAKAAVQKMKKPQRLGLRPDWDTTTEPQVTRFPDRPMMRVLSEHQVPPTSHPSVFIRAGG